MHLEDSDAIIAIKSKSYQYISASRGCAELTGFDESRLMIGVNDHQVLDHSYNCEHYSSASMVEEFMLEDEEVLRGKNLFIFVIQDKD